MANHEQCYSQKHIYLKLMISLIPISYKTAFIEQLLHFSYIASLYYQSRNARFCQHCES